MSLWRGFPTYGLDIGVENPRHGATYCLNLLWNVSNSYLHRNCTNHISRSIKSFGTISSAKWLKQTKVSVTTTASIIRRLMPDQKPTWNKLVALWNFSWSSFFPFAAIQSGDVILRRILKPTPDAVDYHREIAAQLADITRDLRSMWCHLACCAETVQSIRIWWRPRCPTMHVFEKPL
jgi:hypothetical protein